MTEALGPTMQQTALRRLWRKQCITGPEFTAQAMRHPAGSLNIGNLSARWIIAFTI